MTKIVSYWENNGKYQAIYKKLHKLIPDEGSIKNPESNKELEKLRIASNCYYDLYNNGLCNLAKEFRNIFGVAGTKLLKQPFPNVELEQKMDRIIIDAALEQNVLEVK